MKAVNDYLPHPVFATDENRVPRVLAHELGLAVAEAIGDDAYRRLHVTST